MTDTKTTKQETDWASIELHFRAGKRSLEDIGNEFGVSKGRISQVAKAKGWERDLSGKIDAKAKAKVAREVADQQAKQLALNDPAKQAAKRLGETFVVEANAQIIASAEMVQREDVMLGLEVARGQMLEVLELANPKFRELLEAIAEEYDESGPTANGGWKTDKTNELYRYIISLAGRAKTAKDIAASHTAYIATQRKVLRMEDAANRGESTMDSILSKILDAQQ